MKAGTGVVDTSLSASPDRNVMRTIFERLPHVLYCEKDTNGAYIWANQAFASRCSVRGAAEVLGRRAVDLFAADLAASYDAQDQVVLSTGRSVVNHLEVIGRPDGRLGG